VGAAVLAALGLSCGVPQRGIDDGEASIGRSALIPVCSPEPCGVMGAPEACGMKDDGCGGVQWCGSCACGTTFTACEIDLPVIAEVTVSLGPEQILVVQTSSLSSGADSVLHLLRAQTGVQLAMNDDISTSNPASRLAYAAPVAGAEVRIVVRAKSASTTGHATVFASLCSTERSRGRSAVTSDRSEYACSETTEAPWRCRSGLRPRSSIRPRGRRNA